MTKIKAIAFDVGGVISDIHLWKLCLKFKKIFQSGYAHKAYSETKVLFKKIFQGNTDVEKFLENLPLTENDWKSIVKPNHSIEAEIIRFLNPEIDKFVISNIQELHWLVFWEKTFIKEHFNETNCILSCRVNASKPQRKMWQRALNTINKLPEEILLIDNNPANVKSFREFGGNAIKYCCRWNSPKKLKRDLLRYNAIA
jgi:FMN phosphatase YigB (HAD superfamily)